MGITPHSELISKAFEKKATVNGGTNFSVNRNRMFIDYSMDSVASRPLRGQFIPRDDVPVRDCGRDDAGVSLNVAAKRFLNKVKNR